MTGAVDAPTPAIERSRLLGGISLVTRVFLVNAAVLESLREDALDLEAFDRRAKEPSRPFEKVLEDLKREGLL